MVMEKLTEDQIIKTLKDFQMLFERDEEENLLEDIDDLRIKVNELEDKITEYCKDNSVNLFARWVVFEDFCCEFGRGFQLVEEFNCVEFQKFILIIKSNKEHFINDVLIQFKDSYKFIQGFNFKQELLDKLITDIKTECLNKFIYSFTITN